MTWVVFVCGAAWCLVVILHLMALLNLPHTWGWDGLAFIPSWGVVISVISLFIFTPLIHPRYTSLVQGLRWNKIRPWMAGLAVLLILPLMRVATPLLGDGMDRIEALPAGLRSLAGQPAPLDLALHLLLYYALKLISHRSSWDLGRNSYQYLSYLSGGIAAYAAWALALRWSGKGLARMFIFLSLMLMGSLVMFCGYPENYGLLAAGIWVHLLILDQVVNGERPVWIMGLSMAVLCALHYFAILMLPATLWALYRSGHFKPRLIPLLTAGLVTAAFMVFVLYVVQTKYRGIASIFIAPLDMISAGHLLDYVSALVLSGPAAPVLWAAVIFSGSILTARSATESFLLVASLTFLLFFFFLRPVLGPVSDWDLFSLPAFLFMPYLLLRTVRLARTETDLAMLTCMTVALSLFHTGPWVAVNVSSKRTIVRLSGNLNEEAKNKSWAVSWGLLKMGKYYKHNNNPDKAVGYLYQAVEVNPGSATLRRQVSEQLLVLDRREEALDQFAISRLLYGTGLLREKRYGEAEAALSDYLMRFPEDAAVTRELMYIYTQYLNRPDKAAELKERMDQKEKPQ